MQQHVPWLAAERYEVGEVVGRGGYGMVCRGVDRRTGKQVALKMLSHEAGKDPDVVERMLREQQALVALQGTCAVTVVELFRLEGGAPCLVMEWLDGHDLEEQLTAWEAAKQYGDTSQLLSILKPLTQTLERAHDMGLVHRDIKPANIFLVDAPPGARLLDFGLSRMKSAAPLTAVGMVLGSPSYIAPETWRGNSTELDGRADLFALAVIVFRWLTGQLPFDAADLIAKMTAVTTGPRPSVVARRPDLPPAVDAWMARALAIEPGERFQTGGSFFDAFEAALRGQPWPKDSPESSGVRAISTRSVPAEPVEPPERKSALATAWGAATSLLKRFSGGRKSEGAESERPEPNTQAPAVAASLPPVTEPIDDSPASERKSVWLDSAELEELAPSSSPAPSDALVSSGAPAASSSDAPPSPDAQPPRKGKVKTRSKAKKGKNKAAKKDKAKGSNASKPAKKRKARARKRKG
jgi:serine/threonine-protein kinase